MAIPKLPGNGNGSLTRPGVTDGTLQASCRAFRVTANKPHASQRPPPRETQTHPASPRSLNRPRNDDATACDGLL